MRILHQQFTMQKSYGTLSETIDGLKQEGYTLDFNIDDQFMTALSPDDFAIDKVYRFEGASNPDDQSILYAISSLNLAVKGVLVNGYGISTVEKTDVLISRLTTHR